MEYIDEDDLDYKTSPMCDPDYAAKGRIRIISRGQMYEVERATLLRYPETKLNEIIRRSQTSKTEFYFNRDPEIINCILNFYATGELHFRHSMCKDEVLAEIKYWKIDETKLAPCCWVWFSKKYHLDEEREAVCRDPLLDEPSEDESEDEDSGERMQSYLELFRHKLYLLLEKPHSSRCAYIWAITFQLTIIASILCFILETIPSCRVPRSEPMIDNETVIRLHLNDSRLMQMTIYSKVHDAIMYLDLTTNTMLTVEVLLRWSVARRKCQFFKNAMNLIDLLACLPTWLQFGLFYSYLESGEKKPPFSEEVTRHVYPALGVARLLRVLRLFRVVKTNSTVRMVFLTWKKSRRAMLLLFGLITIVSIIKGSLIYFFEASTDRFQNIPMGMWWAIVTMTTLGYGDQFPTQTAGYIVGILCAMTGLVVIATPIPIIVDNFTSLTFASDYNKDLSNREKRIKEKEGMGPRKGSINEMTFMM